MSSSANSTPARPLRPRPSYISAISSIFNSAGDENRPLLETRRGRRMNRGVFTAYRRILVVVALIGFALGVTATPIIYAYRELACERYYETHEWIGPEGNDRCAVSGVEKGLASSLGLMTTLTTIAGVINLLTTGYFMRTRGVRYALLQQISWPILIRLIQVIGLTVGSTAGIVLFQISQGFLAFGGAGGYLLACTSFVGAVVEPEQRTQRFGQMQGVAFAGAASAYVVGGILGDVFPVTTPFVFALVSLVLCFPIVYYILPYIPAAQTESPDHPDEAKKKDNGFVNGVKNFWKPLAIFWPRRIHAKDEEQLPGAVSGGGRQWGVTMLAVGTFTSVLATGYAPVMLQIVSTNTYNFKSSQNGYLISIFASVRAGFLALVFPGLIAWGRHLYGAPPPAAEPEQDSSFSESNGDGNATGPTTPAKSSVREGDDGDSDHHNKHMKESTHHSTFDLRFLRASILVHGILTLALLWSSKGWQMYLASALLPLFSGTAPAAKGVVMEMVRKEDRAEVLNGIALVELLSTVVTVSLFGGVYVLLVNAGRGQTIFGMNSFAAFVATLILLFVHLPVEKPRRLGSESDED